MHVIFEPVRGSGATDRGPRSQALTRIKYAATMAINRAVVGDKIILCFS